MRDYQESVTTGQTDWRTDRRTDTGQSDPYVHPGADKSHYPTPRASASLGRASGFLVHDLIMNKLKSSSKSDLKIYLSAP